MFKFAANTIHTLFNDMLTLALFHDSRKWYFCLYVLTFCSLSSTLASNKWMSPLIWTGHDYYAAHWQQRERNLGVLRFLVDLAEPVVDLDAALAMQVVEEAGSAAAVGRLLIVAQAGKLERVEIVGGSALVVGGRVLGDTLGEAGVSGGGKGLGLDGGGEHGWEEGGTKS
jgi:hypothetical protein